jgi:hypothetical protein
MNNKQKRNAPKSYIIYGGKNMIGIFSNLSKILPNNLHEISSIKFWSLPKPFQSTNKLSIINYFQLREKSELSIFLDIL